MAGHSKWANIKHRKASVDAKKSKITTKIVREITVATKIGGSDIEANPRLRLAIDKAKENNIAKDNIERAIQKGCTKSSDANYVELRFEGYAVAGVAVVVDCLTDNKVRTVADVKAVFNKYGANIGTTGCVAFQFKRVGCIVCKGIDDADEFFNYALEAGASDIEFQDDNMVAVTTEFNSFQQVKNQLAGKYEVEFSNITMQADNYVDLTTENQQKLQKFIDALEDLDDVQNVYDNASS